MNNIAIIPARGGSKRIPRKNIKNFIGVPIIQYSIKAALESGLFKEVMVSTDDLEIANISLMNGANVPFMRSSKTSNDYATTIDVLEEVILDYRQKGIEFNSICCIYPCAPFCNYNILNETYKILLQKNYDTVFPVIPYSTPIQRALKIEDDKIKISNSDFMIKRSQDLEKYYYDSAQFYWIKNTDVLSKKKLYTDNSGYIILDELHAQDIDNEIDWKIAELKYKLINKNGD